MVKWDYRVALGEYGGEDSWIVQSGKGLVWANVPDELSSLLRTIGTRNLLDFSLGSDGRYYVKYLAAGREKRKLSKYMWREIDQDPNTQLDRLTLGPNGQHWGVQNNGGSCVYFADVDDCSSFLRRFSPKVISIESYDEIEFVALGVDRDWAFAVNGRVEYRGSNLLRNRLLAARRSGKKVLSMAMSPISRIWFISFDDGTMDYNLPQDIAGYVEKYCQPQHSLISRASSYNTPPREAVGWATTPVRKTSTTLRILSPGYGYGTGEYLKIANLFENAWAHAHKALPAIKRIFAVELPDHLEDSYSSYKSLLVQTRGSPGVNERLVFHGTPRHCSLGEWESWTDLCSKPLCSLCGVLRESFSVARAGTAPDRNFLRFGYGIYTTNMSSKADDYTNDLPYFSNRVLVVAKVLLGRASVLHRTTQTLLGPPAGFDSVLGEVGMDLNYDEQVLYRDDAIRPAYVIIYEPESLAY